MARWIAFIALTIFATGCSVRVQNGTVPRYDYSEYESYGEQLGTSPSYVNQAPTATIALAD